MASLLAIGSLPWLGTQTALCSCTSTSVLVRFVHLRSLRSTCICTSPMHPAYCHVCSSFAVGCLPGLLAAGIELLASG